MRYILKEKKRDKHPMFLYTVEDDNGVVYAKRRTSRKYEACMYIVGGKAPHFYGRIDLVGNGWNKWHGHYYRENNILYEIVYTKDAIAKIVERCYNYYGIQEAINEAHKYATVIDKFCGGCDNYYPSFKDEDFCLICGSTHTKRKDPDLLIPLENKEI